jgi:DNA-binding response OmpR family regulator
VSVAGVETLLTPTEFSILEYLIRHRGKPVPQHELSEHVFDFAKENWSNTIEVHIKNLRKKLQIKDYENPIKTVRGVGYTL